MTAPLVAGNRDEIQVTGGVLSQVDSSLKQVAQQFVELAAVPNTTDAIKLLDEQAFGKRLLGRAGSAAAQMKNLKVADVLRNLARRAFESTPANGCPRHWQVLGQTTFEGQPAVLVRYFSEPRPPVAWVDSEDFFRALIPLISWEEFVQSAGVVFQPVPARPGELGTRVPSQPDGNGFLPPRAGYLLLCFEPMDGGWRLTDLVNPLGQIRLSRVAGELYLRDWEVNVFMRSELPKDLPDPISVSIFGAVPKEGIDMGIELDRSAYYSRYQAKNQGAATVGPLSPDHQPVRAYRVFEVVLHLDALSPRTGEVVEQFRKDYPGDPGADLALVCFPMMRKKLEVNSHTAKVIDAAAERLWNQWRDPFLRYVQWTVAEAAGDSERAAALAAQLVGPGGFATSELYRALTGRAIEGGNKPDVLKALVDVARFWNPAGSAPDADQLGSQRNQWNVLSDQLAGKQTGLGAGRGTGPPGPPGREGGLLRGPPGRRGNAPAGPPRGFGNQSPAGAPPGFGTPRGRPSGPPRPPAMEGPQVKILITLNGPIQPQELVKKLTAELGVTNHRFSQSGKEMTVVLGYDGTLQSVEQAIDFGEVVAIDEATRTVRVNIPN